MQQTNLISALTEQSNYTLTQNGALTNESSKNSCVDFFFQAPTADIDKAMRMFHNAYIENPELAVRLAFWIRSPRQGAGMRDIGRQIFRYIANDNTCIKRQQLFTTAIGNLGRWDDLISLFDTAYKDSAMTSWAQALIDQNGLAAKWAPRERSSNKKAAKAFARFLKINPKEYRKLIAGLSKTVEQDMCSGNWQNIEYSHVPSQAMKKLRKAFQRRDSERFETYLEDVQNGKETINASTLWPHQILGECIQQNWGGWGGTPVEELDKTSTQLWNNLPNWVDSTPTLVVETLLSIPGILVWLPVPKRGVNFT